MARSARSSGIKKNKAVLKKRVFGPVETARNERMNAKLLELASAPKEKMEVEETKPEEEKAAENADDDVDMDPSKPRRSKREVQRRKSAQALKFERKSNKKPRNQVSFPSHPRKKKAGKK
ncbi:unnamed protein product [Zymoseptoria tritici ST99CH_1E4]|uniref:DUF2423 domain-containing protein n=1 Tax=Zymoseptoria tritici ST99CH_1E4 TaxID=1276532 RepID=A0A2H1GT89_ZYMTR|nr:unnamed protein product [Zymoseptoria tritici ST99CH_1E4]